MLSSIDTYHVNKWRRKVNNRNFQIDYGFVRALGGGCITLLWLIGSIIYTVDKHQQPEVRETLRSELTTTNEFLGEIADAQSEGFSDTPVGELAADYSEWIELATSDSNPLLSYSWNNQASHINYPDVNFLYIDGRMPWEDFDDKILEVYESGDASNALYNVPEPYGEVNLFPLLHPVAPIIFGLAVVFTTSLIYAFCYALDIIRWARQRAVTKLSNYSQARQANKAIAAEETRIASLPFAPLLKTYLDIEKDLQADDDNLSPACKRLLDDRLRLAKVQIDQLNRGRLHQFPEIETDWRERKATIETSIGNVSERFVFQLYCRRLDELTDEIELISSSFKDISML